MQVLRREMHGLTQVWTACCWILAVFCPSYADSWTNKATGRWSFCIETRSFWTSEWSQALCECENSVSPL